MSGRSFELQRELGDGAFGTVYLADMVSLGGFRKSVAIKLLKPDWDAASDAARRLRDEARLLGRLRHRHIVQVDDLVRLDGRWAVVMEYVPGVDLEVLIQRSQATGEPIPVVAALEITAAVAQALDAAWNGTASGEEGPLRVVHRDIKPSNIRLTDHGDVKVLDFGIARADFQGREAQTDKVRYGSVAYMSPERLLGDPEVPGGDTYAVGVVLYELLTGITYGRTKLAPEKAEAQRAERLAEARDALGPRLDPVLELVERCLAYDVDARPTAAEVAEEARRLARRFDDDDIYTFAASWVPGLRSGGVQVERRLLTEQLPDSSTFAMDAETPGVPLPPPSRGRPVTQPTLAHALDGEVPGDTEPPAASTTGGFEQPAPAGQRMSGGLVAGLLLGLVLVGVGIVMGVLLIPRQGPTDVAVDPSPAIAAEPQAVLPAGTMPTATADAPPVEPGEPAATPAAASTSTEAATAAPATTAAPAPATGTATSSTATSSTATSSTATSSTAAAGTAAPEAAPAAGPPVDRAKFFVPGAARVQVSCGGVANASTTQSVQLNDFPAGSCTVSASVDGAELSARVSVTRPAGFTCEPAAGRLTCTQQ